MQVFNADCLSILPTLPDKSIDLFICDLPYGCLHVSGTINNPNYERHKNSIHSKGAAWDIKLDLAELWKQIERLAKNDNTPIIFFCSAKFGYELITSNPDWFRYDLILNKGMGINYLSAGARPMISHELIYVFGKKMPTYNKILIDGKCPLSVLQYKLKRDKRHPTAKQIDLYKWLIERYSNPEDTVLDPTAGSFNSGRACMQLNRRYIGIEKDEKFFTNNTADLISEDTLNGTVHA